MLNRALPRLYLRLICCLVFSIGSLHAMAATITDCNEANLRSAVAEGGTITLACDGTIVLTQPLIIDRNTVINASGHVVRLSGSNSVRMFVVSSNISLTLIGLQMVNGSAEAGGAILNDAGILDLTNCVFAANSSVGTNGFRAGDGLGGAVFNRAGTIIATSCTFSNNQARGGAGAQLYGSSRRGGEAYGGALYSDFGQISFTNCVFISNSVLAGNGADSSDFLSSAGSGGGASGGAIWASNVTVNAIGCVFAENAATGGNSGTGLLGFRGGDATGGAVAAALGQVVVSRSSFHRNTAAGGIGGRSSPGGASSGGAISCYGGFVDLSDSHLSYNTVAGGNGRNEGATPSAVGQGGALFSLFGTVTVARVLFSTNSTLGATASGRSGGPGGLGEGGAIYTRGSCNVVSSAFVGNSCQGGRGTISEGSLPPAPSFRPGGDGAGGAVYNLGTMHILNSTLAYNQSLGGERAASWGYFGLPGVGRGGGIFNKAWLQVVHATISANQADVGGGLWSDLQAAFTNSIIAFSLQSTNCFGTILDGGHNLSSDASCFLTAPGSRNNIDPLLGTLGNHGGPTPTFLLLPTSPAIDAGKSAASPPTDQRGVARPVGVRCDIGAVEVQESEAGALLTLEESTPQTIQIRVLGRTNTSYRLLASPNFQAWTSVATNLTDANGRTVFTHSRSAQIEFYKVVTP
jgi:fibronectin-binding autotransporter adhesin